MTLFLPLCTRPSIFSVSKDDKSAREVASPFEQEKKAGETAKNKSQFGMVNPLSEPRKLGKNKPVPPNRIVPRTLPGPGHGTPCPETVRRTLAVWQRGSQASRGRGRDDEDDP